MKKLSFFSIPRNKTRKETIEVIKNAFFITSIVSFLVLFLGIEKKDNFFIYSFLFFFY